MSDLVERLRAPMGVMKCAVSTGPAPENKLERRWLTALEAADRIEQLEAEGDKARARGDRMRMALEDIAYPNPLHNEDDLMRIARAALEASDEPV